MRARYLVIALIISMLWAGTAKSEGELPDCNCQFPVGQGAQLAIAPIPTDKVIYKPMWDSCPNIQFEGRSRDPRNPDKKTNLSIIESIHWDAKTHTYTITGPELGSWLGYPGVKKAPKESDANYDPNKLKFTIQVGGSVNNPLVVPANVQEDDLPPAATEYATCDSGVLTFHQFRTSGMESTWIANSPNLSFKFRVKAESNPRTRKIENSLIIDFSNGSAEPESVQLFPGPQSDLTRAYSSPLVD